MFGSSFSLLVAAVCSRFVTNWLANQPGIELNNYLPFEVPTKTFKEPVPIVPGEIPWRKWNLAPISDAWLDPRRNILNTWTSFLLAPCLFPLLQELKLDFSGLALSDGEGVDVRMLRALH